MRNDLYIAIERGEFEKGGKSVARNVEVTMLVVQSSGQILKVRRCGGGGGGAFRLIVSGPSVMGSADL